MGKCPRCKQEIEHLCYFAKVESFGLFQPNSVNFFEWEETDRGEWDIINFVCPKCNEIITTKEHKAKEILELNT